MKAIARFDLEGAFDGPASAEAMLAVMREELEELFIGVRLDSLELELETPWVTMGPNPHFVTCQRCGKHNAPPELPCPMEAFTLYLDYVRYRHRDCQEASA